MSEPLPITPKEITQDGDPERRFEVTSGEVREVVRWVSSRRHIELTLYGSVTLIAAILAVRVTGAVSETRELLGLIWASAVGLAVAHWFAASVAGRVSSPQRLPLGHYIGALWQSYPLILAAVVATIGAVIGDALGDSIQASARGADLALISLCAAVAWAGASAHNAPLSKRIGLTVFVVLFASLISGAKLALGY